MSTKGGVSRQRPISVQDSRIDDQRALAAAREKIADRDGGRRTASEADKAVQRIPPLLSMRPRAQPSDRLHQERQRQTPKPLVREVLLRNCAEMQRRNLALIHPRTPSASHRRPPPPSASAASSPSASPRGVSASSDPTWASGMYVNVEAEVEAAGRKHAPTGFARQSAAPELRSAGRERGRAASASASVLFEAQSRRGRGAQSKQVSVSGRGGRPRRDEMRKAEAHADDGDSDRSMDSGLFTESDTPEHDVAEVDGHKRKTTWLGNLFSWKLSPSGSSASTDSALLSASKALLAQEEELNNNSIGDRHDGGGGASSAALSPPTVLIDGRCSDDCDTDCDSRAKTLPSSPSQQSVASFGEMQAEMRQEKDERRRQEMRRILKRHTFGRVKQFVALRSTGGGDRKQIPQMKTRPKLHRELEQQQSISLPNSPRRHP